MRSNEPYTGKVDAVKNWELLFLIVKNWTILTFTKCYAILRVPGADTGVSKVVLWSFSWSSENLQKFCVVGFKLETHPVSGYMGDCLSKTEKECLSVARIPLVPAELLLPTDAAISFPDWPLDGLSAGILQLKMNWNSTKCTTCVCFVLSIKMIRTGACVLM